MASGTLSILLEVQFIVHIERTGVTRNVLSLKIGHLYLSALASS